MSVESERDGFPVSYSRLDTVYPESTGEWQDITTLQDGFARRRFVSEAGDRIVVIGMPIGVGHHLAFERQDGYWEWWEWE